MTDAQPVTLEDIRAKLTEIDTSVQSTKEAAAPIGMAVGAGAVVIVVALAFVWGRRRGRKRRTVVEIRRI
ncbi:MAG: hypothetical protein ACYDH6_02510 [Acidimicrobiales bacterium]